MPGLLDNKTALITGAASGIGRAAAELFAREGARLVLGDVEVTGGEETVRRVRAAGGQAVFVRCDVTRAAEVEALVQTAVREYGRLDCAFNNAGIEGRAAPTADCSEDNWDRVLEVNLKGVWLCLRAELRQFLAQGNGGAVVNAASVAGVVAERGLPAYAAAKGGVIQLTRTAAIEYASRNIRINAIGPGAVQTPMIDRTLTTMDVENMAPGAVRSPLARRMINGLLHTRAARRMILNLMHPLGRPGQPEEIAAAAAWLCSDASSFITGHHLLADGGMTAA